MRNVLFLDFDGVLNSFQWFVSRKGVKPPGASSLDEANLISIIHNHDPHNVWCLKYILEEVPTLEIVISSAWRKRNPIEQIREGLAALGVPKDRIVDYTPVIPSLSGNRRRSEIEEWLDEHRKHGEIKYFVLDDAKVYDDGESGFIRTDQLTGLTFRDACSVIRYFNPDWQYPVVLL